MSALSFHDEISKNHLRASTQSSYGRKQEHFIEWLKESYPDQCTDQNGSLTLINIPKEALHAFICERSVWNVGESKTHVKGEMKSRSVPEGYHAAIVDVYKKLKTNLPIGYDEEWKKFVSGYKNRVQDNIRSGKMSSNKGSDSLTFDGYIDLCKLAICSTVWYCHAFITLAWNLMTRISNTSDIKYSHISWDTDHMNFEIPCHKGDPKGENASTSKAVYFNPDNHIICVGFALAIHVLSSPNYHPELFTNDSAHETFNDWLKSTLEHTVDNATGKVNLAKLTSHSTRKGSSTYATSITGVANVIQVWLRAGWSLTGSLNVYIEREDAGDKCVGRLTSGLNPYTSGFAKLCARFNKDIDIDWSTIFYDYDKYPECFKGVMPYLAACAAYYVDEIPKIYPPNHPIFSSKCMSQGKLKDLKKFVLDPAEFCCPTTGMRATGVPMQIQQIYHQRQFMDEMKNSQKEFQQSMIQFISNNNRNNSSFQINSFTDVAAALHAIDAKQTQLFAQVSQQLQQNNSHIIPAATTQMVSPHQNSPVNLVVSDTATAVVNTSGAAINTSRIESYFNHNRFACHVPSYFKFPTK